MIAANPHVRSMAPYALADLKVPDGMQPVSMAQNESLRPPSPLAIEAGNAALAATHRYPDPDWVDLRGALAATHRIAPETILCGAGSMELIACLARAYAGPERAVLSSQYGYALFRSAAASVQARCDLATEADYTVSVDAYLAAVQGDTKLVFVANPANPTGTRVPRSELVRLRRNLPDNTLLVIDEAYGEFSDGLDTPMFDLLEGGDTVVLRTFSKAYGLAGARVGWGAFPVGIAAQVRKLLNPNNISTVAQAMASAAVDDQPYMRETVTETARLRDRTAASLTLEGFSVARSFTNFLLIGLNDSGAARRTEAALRREGILLRSVSGYGLPHCLRATVADLASMTRAENILRAVRAREGAT